MNNGYLLFETKKGARIEKIPSTCDIHEMMKRYPNFLNVTRHKTKKEAMIYIKLQKRTTGR